MADGANNGTPPPLTPPPGTGNTPPASLKIGDREYSAKDVEALIANARKAEVLDQQMDMLLNPDVTADARNRALYQILSERFGADTAQAILQGGDGDGDGDGTEEEEEDERTAENPPPRKTKTTPAEARNMELEQELNALKQRIAANEQHSASATHRRYEEVLSSALDQALLEGELAKMIKHVEGQPQGAEKAKAFRESLRSTLYMQSKNLLNQKYSQMRSFQEGWIPQAAKDAAKAVAEQYRPVIETVPGLGRASETDAGQEAFLASKPVEPPKEPKVGKEEESLAQLRAFAQDSLRRGWLETQNKQSAV